MSLPGPIEIETITRTRLGKRLRGIARQHFPDEILNRRELAHLVQVVTNDALLLTDLYAGVSLGEILARRIPRRGSVLRSVAEKQHVRDATRMLFEVRRLPEQIKAVGDKCLFDVGLSGQSDYRGIPLFELGKRSYEAASEILAQLADDRLLGRYFLENRLRNMPIEEEVIFLQQCARRFALYADLLGWLRSDDEEPDDDEKEAAPPRDASPHSVQVSGLASSSAAEAIQAGFHEEWGAHEEPSAVRFSSARPRFPGGRFLLAKEELLAAYERILLFSGLDINTLGKRLERIVVGQEEAIKSLCDEFALHAAGTHNLTRPPSYLFVGPTGVGKNYLVETLIELLGTSWNIEIPLLTLEGPNYTYPSDINELRGATRGFIRSDEDGILTDFHRKSSMVPLSIILIDEVEKAHPQLRKFFLSIMDRGTVTDNRGQVLHLANSMIIYTSNIGYSDLARRADPIGYSDREFQERRVARDVSRELRRSLSPEFVNRLRIVHFNHLDQEAIDKVFDLEFARIARRFQEVHGLHIEVTAAARREILHRGYSHVHGARHLRARMESLINVEISRKIKAEDKRRRPGIKRVVRYLRDLKTGRRAFDLEDVQFRVIRETRARVPYSHVRVEFRDGEFLYRGVRD
ncbi:MAG: AAA family ATPase [Acidobacteriota bacterium]